MEPASCFNFQCMWLTCSPVVVWWDGLLVSKLPSSLIHLCCIVSTHAGRAWRDGITHCEWSWPSSDCNHTTAVWSSSQLHRQGEAVVYMSMVHRDGVAQNGVLSLEQGGGLYICMVITVCGSLMHVHVDGGLQLEQHDSVFMHLVGGVGGLTLYC